MLLSQRRRDSGIVLLMVLVAIIVMSIFVTVLLSQNLTQVTSSQDKVDQIKAQELAQGAYWKAYTDMYAGVAPSVNAETLDGKTFTPVITNPGSGVGCATCATYNARVDYH